MMDIKLVLCLANKVDLKANFREKEEDVNGSYEGFTRSSNHCESEYALKYL